MYIGIDAGTSGIKAILLDRDQEIIASKTEKLTAQSPHRGWSEQHPSDWWKALDTVMKALHDQAPDAMGLVQGIGLSGQQHGAVLLDQNGEILRPCILWNDTRAQSACATFEQRLSDSATITGNRAVAGFTAPKLLWVEENEPDIFARVSKVLLPKAWLRFRLTGEMIEDLSDASGTLWLDVGKRQWSTKALAATDLDIDMMPSLVEGTAQAGRLRKSLAQRWGLPEDVLIAGGAGDNAAAAIGLGAINDGDSFISLGTSGVIWRTTRDFSPDTARGLHAFCHAIPDRWHQMGVTLSAASSLRWWSEATACSEDALMEELPPKITRPARPLFLPYLSGERTPHSDDLVRASFLGLDRSVSRAEMTQAVLEGVAFSIRDAAGGLGIEEGKMAAASVIGGGSKSRLWVSLMASVLDVELRTLRDGDYGGAFGAARLAAIAVGGGTIEEICVKPEIETIFQPDPHLTAQYDARFQLYRKSYSLLRSWAEAEQSIGSGNPPTSRLYS